MAEEKTIMCKCGCGGVVFELMDEDDVSLVYYPWVGHGNLSFWSRVKMALKLMSGKRAHLFDVVVDREELFTVVTDVKMQGRKQYLERVRRENK